MRKAISVTMVLVILLASIVASVQASEYTAPKESPEAYYSEVYIPYGHILGYENLDLTKYRLWVYTPLLGPDRMEITRCEIFLWIPWPGTCLTYVLYQQNVWYQEDNTFPAAKWIPGGSYTVGGVQFATDVGYRKKWEFYQHVPVAGLWGYSYTPTSYPTPTPGDGGAYPAPLQGMSAGDSTPTPDAKIKKTKQAYP